MHQRQHPEYSNSELCRSLSKVSTIKPFLGKKQQKTNVDVQQSLSTDLSTFVVYLFSLKILDIEIFFQN